MSLSKYLVTVITAMTLATPAMARGGRDHRHDKHGGEMGYLSPEKLKDLGLSAEQKDKLKELRQSHKEEGKKLHDEMKEARKAFKDALKSDASKEEVRKAYEAMVAKKSEMGKARLDGLLQARDVLTKEQRAKLFDKEE